MSDSDSQDFEMYRSLMFSIAYRMLGSASDADDIVQEAYLRYQTIPRDQIQSHKALLTTIVTRLCLNDLDSAHSQRETYIGPWLPEPIVADVDDSILPARQAELHDSLSIAFLALLEQLTPMERAVFLLREVFDYEFAEIAQITGQAEAACRQMLSRARKHIAAHRPRFKPSPEIHHQMLTSFIEAIGTGDMSGLMELLSEDVTMWSDGGGKSRGAALLPIHGRDAVTRFLLASPRFADVHFSVDITEINGELAIVLRAGRTARIILSVTLDADHIDQIRILGNPDKLKWINEQGQNSEESK